MEMLLHNKNSVTSRLVMRWSRWQNHSRGMPHGPYPQMTTSEIARPSPSVYAGSHTFGNYLVHSFNSINPQVRTMNNGSGARSAPRRDLQLNLSPPAPAPAPAADAHDNYDGGDSSSPSSCVSSDGSPGAKSTMVIGACTRCLMYCMVAKRDYPTCINCKQPCLVDLLNGEQGGAGTAAAGGGGDKKRGKRK